MLRTNIVHYNMGRLNKYSLVLCLIAIRFFSCAEGISGYEDKKAGLLTENDKRGVVAETKNSLISSKEEPSLRSKTAKRGILPLDNTKRRYGDGPLDQSRYGEYEPGRYGGGGGGGYPHSGLGPIGDERPPYYEPEGPYHHSGSGGYIGGRPSGYGPSYGHGPPPGYYGGSYDDDRGYPGHSGIGDQGIGGYKALTLKKILIPLAGLAILGVAAAASQNPVLLQLGSISGRRKRSLALPNVYPANTNVKPLKAN